MQKVYFTTRKTVCWLREFEQQVNRSKVEVNKINAAK